jgi:hypothetical protein
VNNDWAPAPDDHVVICSGHASGSINTTRTCCRVRGRCECHDDEQRADCDEIFHFVILLRRRPIAPRRLIDARRPRRPVTGMLQPPGSKLPQPAEIVHTAITTPHISQDFCSRSSPSKNSRRAFAPALWARGRGLGRPRTLTSDSTTRPRSRATGCWPTAAVCNACCANAAIRAAPPRVRQLERRAETIGRLVDRIGYRPAKDLDERFHDAAPDPVRVRTGLCGTQPVSGRPPIQIHSKCPRSTCERYRVK